MVLLTRASSPGAASCSFYAMPFVSSVSAIASVALEKGSSFASGNLSNRRFSVLGAIGLAFAGLLAVAVAVRYFWAAANRQPNSNMDEGGIGGADPSTEAAVGFAVGKTEVIQPGRKHYYTFCPSETGYELIKREFSIWSEWKGGDAEPFAVFNDDRCEISVYKLRRELLDLEGKPGSPGPFSFGYNRGCFKFFGQACCCLESLYYKLEQGTLSEEYISHLTRILPKSEGEVRAVVKSLRELPEELSARKSLEKHVLFARLNAYYHFNGLPPGVDFTDRELYDIECAVGNPVKGSRGFFDFSGYLPIYEIMAKATDPQITYIKSRSVGGADYAEYRAMEKILDKGARIDAHGVELLKGGLRNILNLMLEKRLRPEVLSGGLGPSSMSLPDCCSGGHGPFYLFLGGDDGRQIIAALVPKEEDMKVAKEVFALGGEHGILSKEAVFELSSRIITYEDFLALDDDVLSAPENLNRYVLDRYSLI